MFKINNSFLIFNCFLCVNLFLAHLMGNMCLIILCVYGRKKDADAYNTTVNRKSDKCDFNHNIF